MENLAKKLDEKKGKISHGTIRAWSEENYIVDIPSGTILSKLSAGCILQPEAGDKVLLYISKDACYILHVLEKGKSSNCSFNLGGVSLQTNKKNLFLEVNDINLLSAGKTSLETMELNTKTLKTNLYSREFFLFSRYFLTRIESVKLVIDKCSTWLQNITSRIKNSYSTIEGLDQKNTGRMRYSVKDGLWFSAKRSFFKAKEKIKINAKKINLG